MTDVIMPQMGESIAEGTVLKWLKNVGDKVQRDEPLFEISTDKVDAEIPAPAAGVLREIRVQVGQTVAVNTVVGVIAAEGEALPAPAAAAPSAPSTSAPTPIAPPAGPPVPPPPTIRIPMPPAPPVSGVPAPPPIQPPPLPQAARTSTGVPPAPQVTPAAPQRPATPPAPAAAAVPSGAPMPPPVQPPARPAAAAFEASLSATIPPGPPPAPEPTGQPQSRGAAGFTPAEPRGGLGGATEAPPSLKKAEMTVEDLRQTRSSPVVRNIAAEHGVDLRNVPGTGISGRVTKQDILTHIEKGPAAPAAASAHAAAAPAAAVQADGAPVTSVPAADEAPPTPFVPAFKPSERVEIVPMSPIRKKTAEHMTLSKRISAHVSSVWEVDMSRVDELRRKYKKTYEERHGVKLTYLPFIMKATVSALKAFPILNASVDGDKIVYKKDVNLGMAVALDWGLIVPVIRSADEKSVLGLARTAIDLAERARSKQLKVDEIQGGTFTITNPGVFGSLFGTPILNQPQVGILAVGTIEKRPVVRDDAIAVRTMAYFALTFDHRIVDGADADRFMALLKRTLQEFDESDL